MKSRLATIFMFALAGCATQPKALQNADETCVLRHSSGEIASINRLPVSLRKLVRTNFGEMADRGEYFNSGDVVVKPGPFNRYMRAGKIGERWYLWFEHGGIAYWREIVLLALDSSGTAHVIAEEHAQPGQNLCAMTVALDAATL